MAKVKGNKATRSIRPAITPEAIQLDEYVQEKPGCYKKKSTKIELNVADKRN